MMLLISFCCNNSSAPPNGCANPGLRKPDAAGFDPVGVPVFIIPRADGPTSNQAGPGESNQVTFSVIIARVQSNGIHMSKREHPRSALRGHRFVGSHSSSAGRNRYSFRFLCDHRASCIPRHPHLAFIRRLDSSTDGMRRSRFHRLSRRRYTFAAGHRLLLVIIKVLKRYLEKP